MTPAPPTSTLFPYTTLFRSRRRTLRGGEGGPGVGAPRRPDRPPARPRPHGSGLEGQRTGAARAGLRPIGSVRDRKSTRLNSSHLGISYAVFCLKKKRKNGTE